MMILKRIASIAFGISFLMAIILFTGYGRNIISTPTARIIFIFSGAIALFLNLLSFQQSKHNPIFSFIYWTGSIVLFAGLIAYFMKWPYAQFILLAGIAITGVSFFVSSQQDENSGKSDVLDDF